MEHFEQYAVLSPLEHSVIAEADPSFLHIEMAF
jgi:hypothetical protein